jgi:hypothetical protein
LIFNRETAMMEKMGNIITIYSLITIRTGRVLKSYFALLLLTCLLLVSREGFTADLRGSLSPNPLQRLMKSSDQVQSNKNSYNDSGKSVGRGPAIKNSSPLYNAYTDAAASRNSSNYAAPTAYVSTSVRQVPASKSNSAYNNQFRTAARANPANNVIANAARTAETNNTVSVSRTVSDSNSGNQAVISSAPARVTVVADSASARTTTSISNTQANVSSTSALSAKSAVADAAPPPPPAPKITNVTVSAPVQISGHSVSAAD